MRKAIGLMTWVGAALVIGVPAAADDQTAPCQVVAEQKACPADPQAEARWARKRLKELDEQAETARLNREFNNAPPPLPPSAPPPRQAANLPPPPAPAQYRSALEEYQALREAYDRQLRAYYRAFPAQASARAAAPAPSSLPSQAELAAQDAARADSWHGYDRHSGLGNGY